MRRIEDSLQVQRQVGEVFAFMEVAGNHARFIPNMIACEQTSPGPFGQVGATMRGTLRWLGFETQLPYEITQVVPGRSLAMKGRLGPILFEDGYVLEAQAGGTRINFWLELAPSGLARLAYPFMGLVGQIHARETLANLNKVLETAG